MIFHGYGFAPNGGTVAGSVAINGRPAGDFRLEHDTAGLVDFSAPLALLVGEREIDVQITIDNPRSPSELGLSGDPRRLGLFLQIVRIEV